MSLDQGLKGCTREGCRSTAVAFPKLSFRDAAQNQSSALLRLAVCSEHMALDPRLYQDAVAWPAVVAAHEGRYGLPPIYCETVLSYVLFSTVEAQTYMSALAAADNKARVLRELSPRPGVIAIDEVSQEEFDHLLEMSKRAPS
jgi:hypothetical protein